MEDEETNYRIGRSFFMNNVVELAENLIGTVICRKIDGEIVKCRIVETEAYWGPLDKACHAYNNKKNNKTKYFWTIGGSVYMFHIYVPQNVCFNIVAGEADSPEAVLIRAVEPIEGIQKILEIRGQSKENKLIDLCNGPAKVGKSLKLSLDFNSTDLTKSEEIWLEYGKKLVVIEKSKRINIDYAEEYKDKLWRFTEKGNKFVSKVKNTKEKKR